MHQDHAIGSRVFHQPHEGLGAGVRHGEQAVQQLLMRSTTRWVVGSKQQIVTALEIDGKGGVVLRVCSDGVRRHCCCCCCCVGSARCGTGSQWCCRHRSYKQTTDSCVGCCLRLFLCVQAGFFLLFVRLGAVPSFSPIVTPIVQMNSRHGGGPKQYSVLPICSHLNSRSSSDSQSEAKAT